MKFEKIGENIMDKKVFFKVLGKIVKKALLVFVVACLVMITAGLFSGSNVNILVLATDKGELLTDTVMVVSTNKATKSINVLSLPRDTRITFENGSHGKLNSVYGSEEEKKRPSAIIKKVEEITTLDIDYYVVIHPDGFRDVIDALGGVYFDVPQRMYYSDPSQDLYIDLQPGYQLLDGDKAEQYCRFRSGYATADLGRIQAQQAFIKALFEQKVNAGLVLKIPKLYAQLKSDFDTNISLKDAVRLAKIALGFGTDSVKTYQLPSNSQYIGGASYMIVNEQETQALIQDVFLSKEKTDDSDKGEE